MRKKEQGGWRHQEPAAQRHDERQGERQAGKEVRPKKRRKRKGVENPRKKEAPKQYAKNGQS